MISTDLDRDRRWTWSKTILSQTFRFKIWTVFEVALRYEHLKRKRVFHDDRTENVLYLRVVLHGMELTNCKPAPTPREAGSVKQKPDDDADLDMQECRHYRGIVASLQYLSIDRCDLQFETHGQLGTWREL